jgi:LmbE family N-acetylglucosaminyl deacetylase
MLANKQAKMINSLGTIMSVWAHPDDETFTCAGIMRQAVNNGQK